MPSFTSSRRTPTSIASSTVPAAAVLGGRGLQEDRRALTDITDRVVTYANAFVAPPQRRSVTASSPRTET